MKTIGYLVNTFLRPSESFIYNQIININDYNVEVLTRQYENAGLFPYDKMNIIPKQNALEYTILRNSKYFENVIIKKRVALLHAHFGIEGAYALKFAEKFALPLFVTFHGHDITRLPKFVLYPPAWLNYWLYFKKLQQNGSLFIAVSDFIGNKLKERGFPADKVITNYLGIDTNISIQKKLRRGKNILTVGRLVEKKGTEYLVKAAAEIVKTNPDIKLWICGTGPLETSLKLLVKNLKIENNVIFTGWKNKEEVYKLMAESDVFVLPSITAEDGDCEGLGMVLLEAMIHEVPVIGTQHGGIPEVVNDNVNGFLVSEKNYVDLAEKIRIILSDNALAEKMGKNSRIIVLEKFDIIKQIKKLENLYGKYI